MTGRAACPLVALIGGAIALCFNVASGAAEMPWKIDEPTAQRLAAEAYYGSDTDLKFFDYSSNVGPPFLVFYGITLPPVEGYFGAFAVNPWTGDVWDYWGCHKMSTPALRKSQAEIRRRYTRAELKQYVKLRRLRPDCD
jgi:hypothetical protein